jgi:NarL family two-component system response regulator LiaR
MTSAPEVLRVLLVDDDAEVRTTTRTLIEAQPDMEVVGEAENGQLAVQMAEELVPDVILMDVVMPVMDGVEATRHVVAKLPAVRVIGRSAMTTSTIVKLMIDAGASSFVEKGLGGQDILRCIRNDCGKVRVATPRTL